MLIPRPLPATERLSKTLVRFSSPFFSWETILTRALVSLCPPVAIVVSWAVWITLVARRLLAPSMASMALRTRGPVAPPSACLDSQVHWPRQMVTASRESAREESPAWASVVAAAWTDLWAALPQSLTASSAHLRLALGELSRVAGVPCFWRQEPARWQIQTPPLLA